MSTQIECSAAPFLPGSPFPVTDPLAILQELIAIPSVNPMGGEASAETDFEHRMTEWLVRFFQWLEVPYEIKEVLPGRCNVLAGLRSPGATETILLDAHQDTVPVNGMIVEPFQSAIRDGRIYGRGACDVKGGMAAMLAAFARLSLNRRTGAPNVLMSCSCDEEFTAKGAISLAAGWQAHPGESLFSSKPDLCVVAEPTDLDVVVAHLGVVRWKLRTVGRACHSSRPHEGRNAIYQMAELLTLVRQFANELPELVGRHPLCNVPTLSVGRIDGGVSVNIVPAECEIEIDRRLIPGEDSEAVIQQLEDYLRERTDVPFEMSLPWVNASALSDETNGPLSNRLLAEIAEVAGPHQRVGAWYGTNAASFSAVGVPCVVFGPGSIAQAHTSDEWLEVEQLNQAAEIYYRFCQGEEKS